MTAIGHGNANGATIDRTIELAIATGVAVLVVIGFITSYETLRSLAVTDGGFAPWLAPAVPLSFDLGIIVLSLKIVASAREGRHAFVHRALVAVLSTATVAVNSSASKGTAGQLLHAIPPAMFVICFEGLIADARRQVLSVQTRPANRWRTVLLAPFSTVRSWRQQVLRSEATADCTGSQTLTQAMQTNGTQLSSPRPAPARTRPGLTHRDDRLHVARDALARDPQITAPELVRALREHGHEVSVRTAQRLKVAVSA